MPNKRLILICLLGLAGCSPAGDIRRGEAAELFVFRVGGGSTQLIRYNVDSPALRGL